jgi:hypothetical protein
MSITRSTCATSALLSHPPANGGATPVLDTDLTPLSAAQSPLKATARMRTTDPLPPENGTPYASIPDPGQPNPTVPDSNPHSRIQRRRSQSFSRGFLPRGLADAYRRSQ